MTSGDIAPGLIDPATLPRTTERRGNSWVRAAGAGFAIAGMAISGCSSNGDPGAPDGNDGEGDQINESMLEDFNGIQPPDCSPDENRPSVVIQEQDDGLAVSGVIKNEYNDPTDLYIGATTSRPGEPNEGYRTRLEQGAESTIMIPDEEIEAVEAADGRLTVHLVAMPEGYALDTDGVEEGVVVQEVVHDAIKQGLDEQPTDRDATDINNVLGTIMSQCSNTRFENGEWIHIISTQEGYEIANPRPEGVNSGQGGSDQVEPNAPSQSPDTPEETPSPEAIYPDQIDDIVEELNSNALEHNLYTFNYGVGPAGNVAQVRVSVFMELTGLTTEDEDYVAEFERLCREAEGAADSAGIPTTLSFVCIGPNNLRFP